ncbi:MAG: hypothetical protein RJA70_3356 [Pseudomonadota bacterium]
MGLLYLLVLVVSASACAGVTQPPGVPPSPSSVTRAQPGGDAHDPHQAALRRQLEQPWHFRLDRDQQLRVPLADSDHWKRVRYWVIDHFTGFRYGEDFHAVNIVIVQDAPHGAPDDPAACIRQIEKWARPQLMGFGVQMGPVSATEGVWRGRSVPVRMADAFVDFGFGRTRLSTAWAAYPAYPGACLVFGIAIPWREQPELARQVRARWIREAVPLLEPLTKKRPYRK